MEFVVEIADSAMRDAEEHFAYILRNSNDALPAETWWNGLFDEIADLHHHPARCPLIPEQLTTPLPIRNLLYHSHRVLFDIDDRVVRVHRIYPSAGRPLRTLRQRASSKKARRKRS